MESEDKEGSLREEQKSVDEAGLCKVHGAEPRFGLTRVCARPRCRSRRLFFSFFLSLSLSLSFSPFLPLFFLRFAVPSAPLSPFLVLSLRSPSLARPLNAIFVEERIFVAICPVILRKFVQNFVYINSNPAYQDLIEPVDCYTTEICKSFQINENIILLTVFLKKFSWIEQTKS